MECKFLSHGLALSYDQIVRPCCAFTSTTEWNANNHLSQVDLTTWHNSKQIIKLKDQLEKEIWPDECVKCKNNEKSNNSASVRLGGANAYKNYKRHDITLEIRPGSVCNFACQTCWPSASSRVRDFYRKANLQSNIPIVSNSLNNFDFLLPIKDQIKDIVVLGGEPFYDKNCLKFFEWMVPYNFKSNLLIFTNGSYIDYNFIKNYPGTLTLVFSMDAVGKPAEYIRYGTEWDVVLENFNRCKQFDNVKLRVNITLSTYNYFYLAELISLLISDWPEVVTFGFASAGENVHTKYMDESLIPMDCRLPVINSLVDCLKILEDADIESGQRSHVSNAVDSIITNLKTAEWDKNKFEKFKNFVSTMDQAKNINIKDYCPEVAEMFLLK